MAEGTELAVAVAKRPTLDVQSVLDQKVLDTPRFNEACRRLGLMLEDLQIRSFDSFHIPGDIKQKQQLRFEHYEKKRKERLAQVLAERAKVIAQNAKKGEVPGVQSAQFLSMLESLFEKEAKRLEVDLKGQLRQHSSLVKDNEDQLRKEQMLQERLIEQERRRSKSQSHFVEASSKTREKRESKESHTGDILSRLDQDFKAKQEAHGRSILAEEERMARFSEAKSQESSDKAAVFKNKVDDMKKKTEQRIVERRSEGESKLLEIGKKIAAVDARREEEQQSRMMLSEQQHLHILDVRENKSRIDRVDDHRRGELKDQVESNVERIETLLALKDQLLDQRKARNMKAEASKGSRGLNLRRDCLPGPGQYEAAPSCLTENPAPKMALAQVPGMLDEAIKATLANPAPGSYDIRLLANGDAVSYAGGAGGKFGDGDRKTFLDEAQKIKEFVPAPGRYEAKSSLDAKAPKMARAKFEEPDKPSNKKSAKQFPAWARPGTDTPGPAGYNVDDFTRKEVMRRAVKSLPNLTRDMLRPGKGTIAK
mmetsp:Transcript_23239/g.65690  ORF Transcript_23239/g.65690 Transcript_23239/m.65690 type:complete len:538 (+) Transcript_23239:163-1776(+)|eukprot:CAMPEP_0177177680 /NCGR_PEP_ID=MMETSP0367-20130122/13925_1 /TAXON_ID=447022 ORGANISM="Scrippsiella hangoei-like, Strain SHHI-4" /NCGR_SAMPLE_ID=MMETSP0367 /ASSEMBLY_ACC=CAM_ASM_000362 /LENGTH=537 /DNA_ID=CAMNT_0018624289 /DNA_START=116 /DNA_END=1729 /DNA_ORIENTATION=-